MVREILAIKPRTKVEFWTDKKYYKNVVKITTELEGVSWGEDDKNSGRKVQYIRVRKVFSGKFRRYNWTFKEYFQNFGIFLKDIVLKNFVGFIGFALGIFQSFFRMFRKKNRPDVIFLKGGFVGLPVGLVARSFRIPYVIHESDATPGLANRLLMKRAKVVASTMEMDVPNNVVTGVPVAEEFKPVSATRQKSLKKTFGFDEDKPLLIVTGGSQGAEHLNTTMREILPELLKNCSVGLVAGRAHYEEMVDLKKYEEWDKAKLKSNFRLWSFSPVMNELMGAADVVVSRAGATTIAELSALKKAVILVPFEKLPGGHQSRNADKLAKDGAVIVVRDDEMMKKPELLLAAAQSLMRSPKKREMMAEKLHEMARPNAAKDLAEIILKLAQGE